MVQDLDWEPEQTVESDSPKAEGVSDRSAPRQAERGQGDKSTRRPLEETTKEKGPEVGTRG
jgi:hypothetical protein